MGTSQKGMESWNTEGEKSTAMGAIAKQQLVKIQHTEKT
jgi:hypothetical protein